MQGTRGLACADRAAPLRMEGRLCSCTATCGNMRQHAEHSATCGRSVSDVHATGRSHPHPDHRGCEVEGEMTAASGDATHQLDMLTQPRRSRGGFLRHARTTLTGIATTMALTRLSIWQAAYAFAPNAPR